MDVAHTEALQACEQFSEGCESLCPPLDLTAEFTEA